MKKGRNSTKYHNRKNKYQPESDFLQKDQLLS